MSQTGDESRTAQSLPLASTGALPAGDAQKSAVWLNGTVLSCACPECRGPMSIRAWLMIGDCAQCGASVELSFEQVQEVRRLLAARETAAKAAPPQPVAAAPAVVPPRPAVSRPNSPAAPAAPRAPTQRAPAPMPQRAPAQAPRRPTPVVIQPTGNWLSDLPAWLVSLVFHLVLILLLGMLRYDNAQASDEIVLSAVLGPKHQEGEPAIFDPKKDDIEVESAGEPPKPELPPAEALAQQDAEELRESPAAPEINRPKLSTVLTALSKPSTERMFEGRDPRIRSSVVNSEGGTTMTEAAVARGLRWIAAHQSDDGCWSLHRFHRAGECDGQCGGHGAPSDTAGTALALLPMLGAGQTHLHGRYTRHVAKGLKFLLDEQREDGDLRGDGVGQMYGHGMCAIVLCEAYALTGDEQLREPAQLAVDFIVEAQHSAGGWRYRPMEAGDTSVVGWQLMALRSAKMALLDVPDEVFSRAASFLDSVRGDEVGGLYSYQRGGGPSPAMTAEALLCRQYLGWPSDAPGLVRGSKWLVQSHPPSGNEPNIYYWYYATQVLHHLGGERWSEWNRQMRSVLVSMQEIEGHQAGSWTGRGGAIGGHDVQVGGRLYMTSLAICTLEVYYRHLPIYRKVDVRPE